jgi:hypothetical protein
MSKHYSNNILASKFKILNNNFQIYQLFKNLMYKLYKASLHNNNIYLNNGQSLYFIE